MKSSEEKVEFTRNIYTSYNSAIQIELDKHSSILEMLKSERFVSYMKGFVLLSLGIAVLILAFVFSYKYFFSETDLLLPITPVEVQDGLNEIASEQNQETINDMFIQTRYTVFHDSLTESGEHVITALECSPLNTRVPIRQYRYLRLGKSSQEMIAEIKDGIIMTTTQRNELRNYSTLYCNFVSS